MKKRALLAATMESSSRPSLPPHLPVPVEHPSSLSVDAFMTKYAQKGLPVVLKGGASLVTDRPWTLDALVANPTVAHTTVETKRKVLDSVLWARLEQGPRVSVSDFVVALRDGKGSPGADSLYVHDVSIPLHLPGKLLVLTRHLRIPAYFAGDWLQHTPEGTMYRETWPSLFLGPEGTESQTHVDSFGSNFWMALLEGRKRWCLVHPDDMHLLYPEWHAGSPDVVFGVDLARPEGSPEHALFRHARVWDCVLEEGDVLFVPAGTPHFVQNLTQTVAVSCNYIDATNWVRASTALAHQAYTDVRAADLLTHLHRIVSTQQPPRHDRVPPTEPSPLPPPSMSFQQFKHPPGASPLPQSSFPRSKRPRSAYADLVADFESSDVDESND
ncbi:hypothetical protein H310_00983 [Aphanomyces invadans]|uniref:JmjC domain-containing protein n=1 Tax=Aphanomyces invadans TaxID=157072 RepID=A0A024US26_9STRA|nr:hypothetical protein H310_00983 [Aphanomyces invadans]ETW08393.1 hypothetical protein H310_00983 [Aphanomyces invadans]|eukprot:XP_008862198.1 hypothetical protein H310_00983 [Aphanomyces invadans]